MMMPANFTAVNSEVVYGGADLFSVLADTTAPVWNAANVKTFNTNLITLISNSFFKDTVSSTLGVMFNGDWGSDDTKKIFGDDGALKKTIYHDVNGDEMTFGNKIMRTLGMASVVYTLGTANAKLDFAENVKTIW